MTNEERIKELTKQKKQIEAEIRELQSETIICGVARIDYEHYPTSRPDEYRLMIMANVVDPKDNRWRTVARDTDKEELVRKILPIINSLEGLKEKIEKGEK